jgi:hypothetical protein
MNFIRKQGKNVLKNFFVTVVGLGKKVEVAIVGYADVIIVQNVLIGLVVL